MEEKELKLQMEKAVKHCIDEFAGLRGSKANPAMLENLEIKPNVLIKHVGMVSGLDNSTLKIDIWSSDSKSDAEKAIREKLNLNPESMGNSIKVTIPPLSGERRQELVKQAKDIAEKARVVVRNIRRDTLDQVKKMKKDEGLSEDMEKKMQKKIDDITKEYTANIDKALEQKEKTILG